MNIKELQFIANFCDHLDNLAKGLCGYSSVLEDKQELTDQDCQAIWSIYHQADLMKELFIQFKTHVDKEHKKVWQEAYPQSNFDHL